MKTLLALLLVGLGILWLRARNLEDNAKTRAHAAAMLAEMRAASAQPAPGVNEEPRHSGNFVTTLSSSGTYRTRELAPGVSYGQSIGNGGGGPLPPTPVPRTMLDRRAYR